MYETNILFVYKFVFAIRKYKPQEKVVYLPNQ